MITEKVLTTELFHNLSADDSERYLQFSQEDLKNYPIEQPHDQSQMIDTFKKDLAAIRTRKKNWLMALGNNVISQEEYLEMTQEDTKKEALLSEELNSMVEEYAPLDYHSVLSLFSNLPQMWVTASDFEKKSFINDLFQTITIDVPANYRRAPGKTPSIIIKHFKLN